MPLGGVIRCIGPPIFGCPEIQKKTLSNYNHQFAAEHCIQEIFILLLATLVILIHAGRSGTVL